MSVTLEPGETGVPIVGQLVMGPRPFLDEERKRLEALEFQHIRAIPLNPTIGAVIESAGPDKLDLGKLDDATFAEIHRAWLEFKVVFFRNQHIDASQQIAFAQRFGELEDHPFLPPSAESERIIRFEKDAKVTGYENQWHSDVSWRLVPSMGSVLRAVEIPEIGGDTLFADMIAAYEGLSEETKARIEGRVAVHDFIQSFGRMLPPDELEKRRKEFPPAHHPIVRTHPETGRKILYVNAIFTSHIEGMSPVESAELLDLLYRQAAVPEYQCRFVWEQNSIAFWDNRAVQHYATSDYWPRRRVMERVTIIGDRPS